MIGEFLTGINILEKLVKYWNFLRGRKGDIASRFVRLFETHGVHRNQIPRFFGHGLMPKDVQDDATLLAKLDDEMLADACTRFAVRREWLDGAEKQVHPEHDFYKYPEDFVEFLDGLIAANPTGDFYGMLIAPEEHDKQSEALLILQETIGSVGDKAIYRFHLCNNWSFTYWKSRAYLTACVAIACKHRVHIHGTHMPKKKIEQLAHCETLLGWQGKGVFFIGHRKWYPEDMALLPEVYLEGIDPELDNFGIRAALTLWLDLEEQGLLNIGMNSVICANPKQTFQQELAKYTEAA